MDQSNLGDKVRADTRGLDMMVEADGDNFSVGEKQLICLARALVRRWELLMFNLHLLLLNFLHPVFLQAYKAC